MFNQFFNNKSSSFSSDDSNKSGTGRVVELNPLVVVGKPGEEYYNTTSPPHVNAGEDIGTTQATTAHHGEFGVPGTATQIQVAVNIFISFVGSGLLGMPFAFSMSGWVLGTITLGFMSMLNLYAMLLLVETRKKLESKGHTGINGYGDVGRIISGRRGENFVNLCLVISQIGFATAYIIFIAANLHEIAGINRAFICYGCVPILSLLVQIQEMKHLSPFSLLADVSNLAGIGAVFFQDWASFQISHETVTPFNFRHILYVASVSLYALEGVGMVIPLESSCADRKWFPSLLTKTIMGITSLMAIFGCCGYFAFASLTMAPITLNLQGDWAAVVQLALCLGLYLTFPIMLFPVNEVMEDSVLSAGPRPNRLFRTIVVIFSATIAFAIPDFGKFLSLVGASICSILGLILPSYFHMQTFEKSELKMWQVLLNWFLILFGIIFGIIGTYDSFISLLEDN